MDELEDRSSVPKHMLNAYQLRYCLVPSTMPMSVAGIPVEAMVAPGSSATIMSFNLIKMTEAGIPGGVPLSPTDLVFHGYGQNRWSLSWDDI